MSLLKIIFRSTKLHLRECNGCEIHGRSGSRKHPKATERIEEGTIKGDWFYRADGSKKKTIANGFRFIEKIQ